MGWGDVANGLLIYNPITKEIYTTSIFKINENNSTKNFFNLPYDGSMFSGLYSLDAKQNTPEHYPIGTAVKVPSNTGTIQGYVLSLPSKPDNSTLHTDYPYTIQLVNKNTTSVPLSEMESIVDRHSDTTKTHMEF